MDVEAAREFEMLPIAEEDDLELSDDERSGDIGRAREGGGARRGSADTSSD